MKKISIISILLFVGIYSMVGQKSIEWMTIEEALVKNQKEPKKIIVDIYTSWCGWCKVMDKTSYSDSVVVDYINKNYYSVKLDGEHKENITLGDKTYKYIPNGSRGYHELAAMMLQGKMSYPSTVIIDENASIIYVQAGYLKPTVLDTILRFFGGNHYKNSNYAEFSSKYVSKAKNPN